jgi:formate dehydrogenase iron-sulfur subunit
LGGDGDVIADIYRQRVFKRGKGSEVWGWGTAYGKPEQTRERQQERTREGAKS